MSYKKMSTGLVISSSSIILLASLFITPAHSEVFSYVPGTEVELLPSVEADLSSPSDINLSGDVVGDADYNWASRAVLWPADGSAPVRLDNSNEFDETNSYAHAINDLGQIVGNFRGAALWVNNQATILDASGVAFDINNNGLIAGQSRQFSASPRAVIWQNQTISLLGGEPEGLNSTARAINSMGDVGGAYFSTSNFQNIYAPALWQNGQLIDLGKLPGFTKQAFVNDLNDFDQLVGYSNSTGTPSSTRAVIWQNGLVASLGTLGGEYSNATKINNSSQIVGYSSVNPGETFTAGSEIHPILWQDDVMYDLSSAVNMVCNTSSKCLGFAHSINDAGEIVVAVTDANGSNSYKLSISDYSQLPGVSAPLDFVTPDGAGSGNPFVVDLALSMQDSPDPVQKDDLLTYDISVTNNGGIAARNVIVYDNLPKDITFDSVSASQGICHNIVTPARGKNKTSITTAVSCNFSSLDIGATATMTIMIRPNSVGTYTNSANVTSDEADIDNSDNSASTSTLVEDSNAGVSKPCKGKNCN